MASSSSGNFNNTIYPFSESFFAKFLLETLLFCRIILRVLLDIRNQVVRVVKEEVMMMWDQELEEIHQYLFPQLPQKSFQVEFQ